MHPLKLEKPLAFIDLETTGIDLAKDRIVEIAVIKVMPDGEKIPLIKRVNPGILIPLEASLVHGIYDKDVIDAPRFSLVAHEIVGFIKDMDIAGFNSNRFDVPLLIEEFLRAGVVLNTDNIRFVDVQKIFHLMEKRDLTAAYKFYCNKDLKNAHSAMADVEATYEVLIAQLEKYNEHIKPEIDFLHDFTKEGHFVDFSRRMIYKNGVEIFNFGKHKGRAVKEVLSIEPQYFDWMMQSDFPLHTKQKLKEIKERVKAN